MRRILYIGLGVLALAGLAIAGLWIARIPLAERYLAGQLEAAGFAEARFEIVELGPERLVIAPVALAPEEAAPAADRLQVQYAPMALLRGDYSGIEIELHGLRVALRPGERGLRPVGLPEAQDAPAGAGNETAPPLGALGSVPSLALRGARVEIESPVGRWRVELDADLEGGPQGPRSARLDAGVRNNRLAVEGEVAARYDGERVQGNLRLRENDGFEVQARAAVRDPLGAAETQLEYTVDMPAAGDLPWPFLPGAPPSAGRVSVSGTAEGRVVATAMPDGPGAWLDWLGAGDWHGDYRVSASGLALAARFEGLEVEAAGRWQSEEAGLTVTTAGEGRARSEKIAEALWSRLSPPAGVVPYLAGPVEVGWAAGDVLRVRRAGDAGGLDVTALPDLRVTWPQREGSLELTARARMQLDPPVRPTALDLESFELQASGLNAAGAALQRLTASGAASGLLDRPEGTVDLELELFELARAGVSARDITLRLPLGIEPHAEGARLALRSAGLVRAGEVSLPGAMRALEPVSAEITEASIDLSEQPRYRAALAVGEGRVGPVDAGSDRPEVAFGPGRVTLAGPATQGPVEHIAIQDFAAALPASGLTIAGASARLQPASVAEWLRVDIDRLADSGSDNRFAPVAVTGTVARAPDGLKLTGSGSLGADAASFELRGRASAGATSGRLEIDVAPIAFEPTALQPRDLSPLLAALERVRGEVGGSLELNWGVEGIAGNAVAEIQGLDFTYEAARVKGLEGRVRVAELRPPRTASPQTLRAEAIDAGVRLEAPTLELALEGAGGGRLGIHVIEAQGRAIDGTVAVRDWRFVPADQVHEPTVQLENVALGELLERLSVDGLAGSGRLSGALPLSIAPAGLAIRDGRLRGEDGNLRYRSERAEQALANTDRSVELMLRAFEDFDYEQIEIGVSRELGGASGIDIHMRGSNPDVLDGHPFKFNISLTGDVQPLLDALARGRELTDELIERNLRMRSDE